MGKKRRGPSLEELLARPWCYYCERDFDDLKILISHQKAKHFKCDRCGRRLNTAGGLSVHMSQVHKESLTTVENALPNRTSLDIEIFGMEGVPEEIIASHNQRVITQFQQAETERQAVTGNPPSGASGAGGQPAKKPKLESTSDLKKRLAEHKAKKAEAATGGSSGDVTPVGAGLGQGQSPVGYPSQTGVSASGQQYPPQSYAAPYQQAASPVYQNVSPGQQQFPAQYPPGYSPQPYQTGVPPQPYGNTPSPFPQSHTPPTTAGLPQRTPSLPTASNLPQRPAFAAPPVNAFQMQQMHMGQGQPIPAPAVQSNGEPAAADSSVQDPSAAKQPAEAAATPPAGEKPKKDKSKPTKLVYSDNEVSPEEKMARLPRYAVAPNRQGETVLQELPAASLVGPVMGEDTIRDPAQ